ncbi:MAG TPA: hypothetical protein VE621_18985 [Bryobacteraceae bacterium]|nr:hypothetical protein [Bryobacteraceae bacterium]
MGAVPLSAITKTLRELQQDQQLSLDFLEVSAPEVKPLLQGIPKGAITEIFGASSSGKSTLMHTLLASAVQAGEFCTLVDASDRFDPGVAEDAGVDLKRLLWVRCKGKLEHAIQATDMLLHGGGWGMVVLDLGDIAPAMVRKLPLSYWYRFRRAVENTSTSFVVVEREPFVRACASLAIEMRQSEPVWRGTHPDFRVLEAAAVQVSPKKPARAGGKFLASTRLTA